MTDPKIQLGASPVWALTSPRDLAEAASGRREHGVVLPVQVPVGTKGNSRLIMVPLDRDDLVRLAVAATSALAHLDSIVVN